jgi:excisionase family DNA binding protein
MTTTSASVLDLSKLPPTLDLVEAARMLGIGRTLAYEMVRDGSWPTPIVRAGRKIRVPTRPLLALLGVCSP